MKTFGPKSNLWLALLVGISTIIVAFLCLEFSRCWAEEPLKSKTPQDVASAGSDGLGTLRSSNAKVERGQVFVFEEFHNSRIGQLQIALMLVRLHEQAALKVIGLEGAIQGETPLNASWFHALDGPEAKREREDVAVRMLASGELNAAEFIPMLYLDVKAHGLELKEQSGVKLDDQGNPVEAYLLKIAEQKLKQADIRRINDLLTQGKSKEALEVIQNSDPWVKDQFAAMTSTKLAAAEHAKRLREIKAKADELGVTVDAKTKAGMEDTIRFFETASKRSGTMVGKVAQLLEVDARQPIAMIIGTAHSGEVEAELQKRGVTYFLISPNALNPTEGSLAGGQFARKSAGRWALESPGTLWRVLNSQRKRPPVIGTATGESYASAIMATILARRAHKDGKGVPDDIMEQLKGLPQFRVDPISFVQKEGNVIFRMWLRTTSGKETQVWARVGLDVTPKRPKKLPSSGPMTCGPLAKGNPP